MPLKSEHQHKRLPPHLDRRVKITPDDKQLIKHMYDVENLPIRAIARHFHPRVSRRSIQLILFPQRLATMKANQKERIRNGRYTNPEKQRLANLATREHRKTHEGELLSPN